MTRLPHQLRGPRVVARGLRRQHGAAAVEFAIAAPILLLCVFVLFEFGRFHMMQHTMENAAYEGARRGIVPGVTAGDCEQVAQAILSTGSISAGDVTVEPPTILPETDTVTLRIRVDLDQNAWVSRFFDNRVAVTSCTLRREDYNRYVSTGSSAARPDIRIRGGHHGL